MKWKGSFVFAQIERFILNDVCYTCMKGGDAMIWWLLGGFFAVCFMLSMSKELRRFRNGIFLLLTFMFCFLGLAITHSHNEWIVLFINLFVLVVSPLSLFILSIGLIGNGVVMVKKEGFRPMNLLSAYFGMGILAFMGIVFIAFARYDLPHYVLSLLILCIFIMLYAAFIFTAFLLYSMIYRLLPKNSHCDYIIIHGAGLLEGERVSRLLELRLDKGLSVYEKGQKRAKIIVSGGQGEDEKISEAEAMKRYLLNKGIDESVILLEDQSTSTYENLLYSKKIMDRLSENYTCIFVTNDYHVFRTSTYARQLKIKAQGVGCRTAMYYLPSAFIREYLAIVYQYRLSFLVIVGIWLLLLGISLGLF